MTKKTAKEYIRKIVCIDAAALSECDARRLARFINQAIALSGSPIFAEIDRNEYAMEAKTYD